MFDIGLLDCFVLYCAFVIDGLERSEIDFSTEIASKVSESRASHGKLCVLVKNHVAMLFRSKNQLPTAHGRTHGEALFETEIDSSLNSNSSRFKFSKYLSHFLVGHPEISLTK
jgi:hypothetical protein